MKPKHFPEANFTWKGGGPEKYGTDVEDLYVLKAGDLSISCWKLTWRERLSSLFYGTVWMHAIGTVPPVGLSATRSVLIKE